MGSVLPLFDIPGVWRGHQRTTTFPTQRTGHRLLDHALLGGWPTGALVQIGGSQEGLGFSLIVDTLAQTTQAGRVAALVQTPLQPYAPALCSAGIALQRLLWVQPEDEGAALWAMEQMARSGLVAVIAYWGAALDSTAERRLQLAADSGQCLMFCFEASHRRDHSFAAVKLNVATGSEGTLEIDICKCRGKHGGQRLRLATPATVEAHAA
ncbi:MAG: translesion DNA synthesis-associated protein ImuA [Nevskiaceae bacterium]|nr:MAG: translesion DNA synthesis-associated protein ImuA [Nevskiaceae bacterium]